MSRIPRNNIKAPFFHIMVQGINKEYIFNSEEGMQIYQSLILKTAKEFNVLIVAYCIMNNHTHILLKVNEMNELTKFMSKINTKYARYYNERNERVGYVFRDRYKLQSIISEKQLLLCIKYIHNNPVKASIAIDMSDYKYSSYCKIYKNELNNIRIKLKEILSEFEEIEKSDKLNFMEAEEIDKKEICKTLVKKYFKLEKINIQKDKNTLKKLICELKDEYGIPYRNMEENMNISRETLRKLYKEAKNE